MGSFKVTKEEIEDAAERKERRAKERADLAKRRINKFYEGVARTIAGKASNGKPFYEAMLTCGEPAVIRNVIRDAASRFCDDKPGVNVHLDGQIRVIDKFLVADDGEVVPDGDPGKDVDEDY